MTLKLRRPARRTTRPRFAEGGAVGISPTPPIQHVDDRPEAAHALAARSLRGSGIDQPTAAQTARVARAVAQDRSRGVSPGNDEAAVSQAQRMHQPVPGLPPSIQAALALRPTYARGGSIAPGLPAAPFAPMPTPVIATPGLASPRGLIAARHRSHFAAGGPALPPHILAALALRPHFDDGGDAGGGESSRSGNGGAGGGDGDGGGDGGGHGNGESSAAGPSGSAGGVGGFGGGSGGDGYGGGSSSSSTSGGHGDASTSSSNSGQSSEGDGGGGHSDASTSAGYGGGSAASSTNSTAAASSSTAGGQSDASTSSGYGGSVGGLGGSAGYGNATSGNVGSIGGSEGAPAAGGFSSAGAPATGGFGSFGAGPAASDSTAGLSGGTMTASSLSGQTAAQSMASEAGSAGDAGNAGAAGLGLGVTTGQALSSFGPAPSSPYGSTANAQAAFGGTAASDLGNVAGLSPMGQQLGAIGLGAMPGDLGSNPTGYMNGPGAYGLSTSVAGGPTPGFDNFSTTGNVQQSMLGDAGYGGVDLGQLSSTDRYTSPVGTMSGAMLGALQGGLPDAEQPAQEHPGLPDYDKSFSPDYSGFTLGPDGKPTFAGNAGVISDTMAGLRGLGNLTVHGDTPTGTSDGTATPNAPGITDRQVYDARQAVIAQGGVATPAQRATISGYTTQQNTPAGLGVAPSSVGIAAPSSVDGGAQAPVGLGVSPSVPSSPDMSDQASQPGQPASLTISGVPGVPDDAYSIGMHRIEGGVLNGQVDPNNPSHYGPAQFSQPTFSGVARNHPELGISPSMSMFSATADQYSAITQALTQDDAAALQKAGLPATPANLYMVHNLGAPVGLAALTAGPDATLSQAGIPGSYVKSNPSIYGGVQTIGQAQARIASMLEHGAAGASTASPSSAGAGAAAGLGLGAAGAPGTFSPSGYDMTASGYDAPTDVPTASPLTITAAPAAPVAPVTRTVMSPAPYGVSTDASTALSNYGMEATPANAYAASVLGLGVASQVMNGDPNDPVSSAGISAATMAANPSLFSGEQTIGHLQANFSKAAQTAGTTTSTVTEPGAPAAAAATESAPPSSLPAGVQAALGPAWGRPGSYAGPSDLTSGFGMKMMAAGVPATVNNAGTLGLPSGVGLSQAEQNFAGYSQVPSSVPTFARAAIAAPGFTAGTGFTSTPTTNGAPDTSTTAATPDTSTPNHLSVPKGVANTAANIGLGIVGGPIGAGIAAVNGLSGLLGGPTIADGINGMLAHAGTAPSSGGQGDNSSQGASGRYSPDQSVAYGSQGGVPDTSAAAAPASSGVNPLDPHATAMAAYQAAINGRGASSGAVSPDALAGYRNALTIRGPGHYAPAATPTTPLYNPMQDPSVLRALGMN